MINLNKKRLLHAPMKVRAAALLFIALMGSTSLASMVPEKDDFCPRFTGKCPPEGRYMVEERSWAAGALGYCLRRPGKRAPASVQKDSLRFAHSMYKQGKISKEGYEYLKSIGAFIVYESDDVAANALAHSSPKGGIYFPKGSFANGKMAPGQRASLAHEIQHHCHGDLFRKRKSWYGINKESTEFNEDQENKGIMWYKGEYTAQYDAVNVLFAEGDLLRH